MKEVVNGIEKEFRDLLKECDDLDYKSKEYQEKYERLRSLAEILDTTEGSLKRSNRLIKEKFDCFENLIYAWHKKLYFHNIPIAQWEEDVLKSYFSESYFEVFKNLNKKQ